MQGSGVHLDALALLWLGIGRCCGEDACQPKTEMLHQQKDTHLQHHHQAFTALNERYRIYHSIVVCDTLITLLYAGTR